MSTEPRKVSTVAELDALPEWSVVMHTYSDGSVSVWTKEQGKWYANGAEEHFATIELLLVDDETTYLTVLHEPRAQG